MEKYINAIDRVANKKKNYFSESDWSRTEILFENWKNEKDKHTVAYYFNDEIFCTYYTKKLYQSRLNCFYEVFQQCEFDYRITEILAKSQSIVSFGCGPGPEIAACIQYIRGNLNCQLSKLHVQAIDQLNYWEKYIEVIAHLDANVNITFQCGTLNTEYLNKMKLSDLCIMSYPHAMNFKDVWDKLKEKFSLIIVLDQAKKQLLEEVRKYGYKTKSFVYKENKTFSYYYDGLNSSLNSSLDSIKLCDKGIHEIDKNDELCKERIRQALDCGHFYENECYRFDIEKIICQEILQIQCDKCHQTNQIKCGNEFICQQTINQTLKCGHIYKVKCIENNTEIVCEKEVIKRCQRNLHWKSMKCCKELNCEETVEVLLVCGHQLFIKCDENEKEKINSYQCRIITKKFCANKFHEYSVPCHEKVNCEMLCSKKAPCGHFYGVKCDNYDQIFTKLCDKIARKPCYNGFHQHSIQCSKKVICNKKFKIILSCGHQRIFICCDIKLDKGKVIVCTKIPCRGSKIINMLSKSFKLEKLEYPILESVCGHSKSSVCLEICNKILECGHLCQRMCNECLNGRLHGSCIIECQKTLHCGHKCGKTCHSGKCNCYLKCSNFENKNPWTPSFKMSEFYQEKWLSLPVLLQNGSTYDIKAVILTITKDLKTKRFCSKSLKNFKIAFKFCLEIVNFEVDVTINKFDLSLNEYINYIQNSLLILLKSVNPIENDLIGKNFIDFQMEFQRLKHIFIVCYELNSRISNKLSFKIQDLNKLLIKIFSAKYSENLLMYFEMEIKRMIFS